MNATRRYYLSGSCLFILIGLIGELIWLGDPIRIGDLFWIDLIEWLFKFIAIVPLLWLIGAVKRRTIGYAGYSQGSGRSKGIRRVIRLLVGMGCICSMLLIVFFSYQLLAVGLALGLAWVLTLADLALHERADGQRWLRRSIQRFAYIAVAISILFYPTAYQVTTPGFTFDMARYAQAEGGTEHGQIEGILVIERPAFPVDLLFAKLAPHVTLTKRDTTQSIGQQLQAAHSQRIGANEVGSAVAFQKLGIGKGIIPSGVYILAVMDDSPAAKVLQPGDQLTSINGEAVASGAELTEQMGRVQPGDTVQVTVARGGGTSKLSVQTKASSDEPRRAVFGIQVEDRVHADLPRAVDYRSYLVYQGGPSHGAVLALSLIDQLTPGGVTYGHRVAGTGTIGADGKVGIIGGIEQKAYAVWRSGADVFFVPAEQEQEARKGAPKLNIVPVQTLDDMLNWLRLHPNKT